MSQLSGQLGDVYLGTAEFSTDCLRPNALQAKLSTRFPAPTLSPLALSSFAADTLSSGWRLEHLREERTFTLGFCRSQLPPKNSRASSQEAKRIASKVPFGSDLHGSLRERKKKHKKIRGSLIPRQARVNNNAPRRGLRWSRWDSPWQGPRGKQQATPGGLVRCPPLEDCRSPVAVPTPPGPHTNARPGHPPTTPVSPCGHPRCGLCHRQASLVQNPSWAHTHP